VAKNDNITWWSCGKSDVVGLRRGLDNGPRQHTACVLRLIHDTVSVTYNSYSEHSKMDQGTIRCKHVLFCATHDLRSNYQSNEDTSLSRDCSEKCRKYWRRTSKRALHGVVSDTTTKSDELDPQIVIPLWVRKGYLA